VWTTHRDALSTMIAMRKKKKNKTRTESMTGKFQSPPKMGKSGGGKSGGEGEGNPSKGRGKRKYGGEPHDGWQKAAKSKPGRN